MNKHIAWGARFLRKKAATQLAVVGTGLPTVVLQRLMSPRKQNIQLLPYISTKVLTKSQN